jgi:methyltransferase (TIGR00027 family)
MRSDDDTWDITTSVGSTALMVAAARALEAQKPAPLAVDPYAEVFCRAVGGRWADVLDGKASDHMLADSDFGAHFVDFQGARTRYFDDFFARAVEAGVKQVVIFAAGLDSRAYRLDWPDGTVIYELDQPRVLEFKRRVVEEHGARSRARRVEISVDLRDDWPAVLRAHGFDDSRPAAFIAEGLLIYLPATAQEALFEGVDALAAPGSFVGIEEGEPMPAELWEFAKAGERAAEEAAGGRETQSFFRLIYNEQCAPAADWFGARGWRAEPTPLADLLVRLGRPLPGAASPATGMVNTNTLVSAVKE